MHFDDDAEASPSGPINPLRYDKEDESKIEDALIGDRGGWSRPTHVIEVGSKKWLPNLVRPDGAVCHIHLTEELSTPWLTRIVAARAENRTVVVAAPLSTLYSATTLRALARADCQVSLVSQRPNGTWRGRLYRSVPELVAMEGLLLDGDLFRELGHETFDRALAAPTNHLRGLLFEDLLCLVFSQVSYLSVFAHNYRNRTQEIDVVLRNRSTAGGAVPVCPLVIVSGKNVAEPVDVHAFASLESKMRDRRGQCKVGFLCSARTIASTVSIQELRGSREERIVVLLDGPRLRSLIDAGSEIEKELNRLMIEAMLA